jgi:hypothetical protein
LNVLIFIFLHCSDSSMHPILVCGSWLSQPAGFSLAALPELPNGSQSNVSPR